MTENRLTPDERWDPILKWSPIICDLRHAPIDSQIEEINDKIKEVKITTKGNEDNLRLKIIVTRKSVDSRIDEINLFLRGDLKEPGLKGEVKQIKQKLDISMFLIKVLFIISILLVGGDFFGLNFKKIKDYFFERSAITQKTTIVEGKNIPDMNSIKMRLSQDKWDNLNKNKK